MTQKNSGRLYLLPAPLDPFAESAWPVEEILAQTPAKTLELMRSIDHFVVESIKTASRLLSRIKDREAMARAVFLELNEHGGDESIDQAIGFMRAGIDFGFLSEAGMPCIADPGAALVAGAHEAGIMVVPIPGPSSVTLALSASGLDAQRFVFLGYLPAERLARQATLRRLGADFSRDGMTRVFIETPYRNDALLSDCLNILPGESWLCVARALCSKDEWIRSARVSAWKNGPPAIIGKSPAVFLFGQRATRQTRNTR